MPKLARVKHPFATVRRALVREGRAADPDALAAWIKAKMRKNPEIGQHVPESESEALRTVLWDLRIAEQAGVGVGKLGDRALSALNEAASFVATLIVRAQSGFHKNPLLAVANPRRRKLAREMIEVRYIHAEDGKAYKHDFSEDRDHGVVQAFVEDGGRRVVLEAVDGRKIVEDF